MIQRANAFLLCALVSFTIWAYARLPERIPVQFDLAGHPSKWGSRNVILLMCGIGVLTAIFMIVITRIAMRNPKLVNMPDKKRFLELSDAEQQRVLQPMSAIIELISGLVIVMFLVIEISMYQSARGHDVTHTLVATLIIVVGLSIVLPIVMLVRVQKLVNEAVHRARMGGEIR